MIAVTFALPNESRDFRRLLDRSSERMAILHTGVGEKATRARLEPFLAARKFECLISSGFAGGVEPSLGVGDLLLAANFSAPELLARAQELLIACTGRLASSAQILDGAKARAEFARAKGALAVDMETETIAELCAAHGLPMLSLRVISDIALAPFPAPPGVLFNLARQKTEPLVLSRYLVRHPTSAVKLVRFLRQVATARRNLTNALAVLVREL